MVAFRYSGYELYSNLYGLIIGKLYSPTILGFYSQSNLIPSVMFPALSANQDEPLRAKTMVRRSIVTSAFIIFPMLIVLAACAAPLIEIVFTENGSLVLMRWVSYSRNRAIENNGVILYLRCYYRLSWVLLCMLPSSLA